MEPEPVLHEMKPCPLCGELILAVAKKCRHCGEYLDPALRAAEQGPDLVERMLVPVGRPASAIAAGYLGLFSFIPIFGPLALIVSLVALRTLKRHPEMSGRGRAIFGLVMGSIMTLLCLGFAVILAIASWDAAQGRRPRF